jgi:tetratricopeptide (TPR) repeat protein
VVLLADSDNAPQVEALLRSAVKTHEELSGPTGPETFTARLMLARVLAQRERYDEALAITDALAADQRAQRPLPADDLGETLNARGRIYWRMKRYDDYERDARETVDLTRQAFGDRAWAVAIARHNHAAALFYLKRFEEALGQSQQALDSAGVLLPPEHPFLIAALQRHGDNAAALQRWDEAARSYETALERQRSEHAAKGGKQREGIDALQARLDAVRAGRVPDAVTKNLNLH